MVSFGNVGIFEGILNDLAGMVKNLELPGKEDLENLDFDGVEGAASEFFQAIQQFFSMFMGSGFGKGFGQNDPYTYNKAITANVEMKEGEAVLSDEDGNELGTFKEEFPLYRMDHSGNMVLVENISADEFIDKYGDNITLELASREEEPRPGDDEDADPQQVAEFYRLNIKDDFGHTTVTYYVGPDASIKDPTEAFTAQLNEPAEKPAETTPKDEQDLKATEDQTVKGSTTETPDPNAGPDHVPGAGG